MSTAKFNHYDLKLIEPGFGSSLTDLILELNSLRKKRIEGSTPPLVFFQLKHIFHTLESVGSARIEGNNTTIAEYIETKLEDTPHPSEEIREISNIENSMSFIEEHIEDFNINKMFISEMHRHVVNNLKLPPHGEGDHTPGSYRTKNVIINHSSHIPPESLLINEYMDELFSFISQKDAPKYDLLKAAIAHHRFVWIHPFTNGNGRTVRLFTYAMLLKAGFNVQRIVNPTAVFCSDRNKYNHYLGLADEGTEAGILSWCEYVLKGLKEEIEKIDKLLDYSFLSKEILLPAINYAIERQYITEIEANILKKAIEKKVFQSGDLKDIFSGKVHSEVSRQIRKLIDKKMLMPEIDKTRKYVIRFDNNFLIRGVIKLLSEKGFLPFKDEA